VTLCPPVVLPVYFCYPNVKKKLQNHNLKREKHSVQFSPSLTRFSHPPDSSLAGKYLNNFREIFFLFHVLGDSGRGRVRKGRMVNFTNEFDRYNF
jgi:hypothetical protein